MSTTEILVYLQYFPTLHLFLMRLWSVKVRAKMRPKVRDRNQVLVAKAHIRYSPETHRLCLSHPACLGLGWPTAASVPASEAHPAPPHPEWQGQLSPMTNVPWPQSHSLCLPEFCLPRGSSRTLHGNHQLCGVLMQNTRMALGVSYPRVGLIYSKESCSLLSYSYSHRV